VLYILMYPTVVALNIQLLIVYILHLDIRNCSLKLILRHGDRESSEMYTKWSASPRNLLVKSESDCLVIGAEYHNCTFLCLVNKLRAHNGSTRVNCIVIKFIMCEDASHTTWPNENGMNMCSLSSSSPHIMGHEIWYCPHVRVLPCQSHDVLSCIPDDDSLSGFVHRGIAS